MKLVLITLGLFVIQAPLGNGATGQESDVEMFKKLAAEGDRRAMTELGLRYHLGQGVPQDYSLAYDWYLKAMEKGDGDAWNNLGVLHRDGLGVPKNQKIAYLIFLVVHMEGMGDDETQMRAGRNLQRLATELSKEDIFEALSYTQPYVMQIIKSRGKDLEIRPGVLPSKDYPRIRDNGWWLDSERAQMTFESPPPWNGKFDIRLADDEGNASNQRIDVETRNATDEKLSDVAIWFGDHPCSSGVLSPGTQKAHLSYPGTITKHARVEWRDAGGRLHAKEVDLDEVLAKLKTGILQFVIRRDNVEVRLLPLR